MKKLLSLVLVIACAGCIRVPTHGIVSSKATVFGLDISADPATGTPHVRFGLVRYFYQHVPTSTNGPVYAPAYSSDVDGDIGLSKQYVHEKFKVGNAATNAP